jgi:hypothetical protein
MFYVFSDLPYSKNVFSFSNYWRLQGVEAQEGREEEPEIHLGFSHSSDVCDLVS